MQTMTLPGWQTLTVAESDTGDGLTITGRAIPYDTEITQAGERITFSRGSIDADKLRGRPVLWEHMNGEVIGTITDAESRNDGVYLSARVLPTSRGRDVITLIRETAVSGLSIGFTPVKQKRSRGVIDFKSVNVREVSITPTPAFDEARILQFSEQEREQEMAEQAEHTAEQEMRISELSEQLTQLSERLESQRHTPAEPPRYLSVEEAFTLAVADYAQNRRTLALADVVSGGNAGLLPPDWSSEVRRYVDASRPMINASGSMGFPQQGHTLSVPKVLSEVSVSARGAEKTSVPSAALTTGVDTFSAVWSAGGVDVSLEILAVSDPSISGLVATSLLEAYAAHSESVHVAAAEAAATATGGPLETGSYGGLIGDLIAGSVAIREATGMPGDYLAATSADWAAILGLVDNDSRRIFSTTGATNADGGAALTAEMINVGGINIFHSHNATVSVQFNKKALRVAERQPTQIDAANVELMGRDFGILGAIITLPLYPAGILAYTL